MSGLQQVVPAPGQLHRIKRVKNQHYVRDGKKSYGHALRKYNIKPTVPGPFDMIDIIQHAETQHVLRRLQDRLRGRPTHVSHRQLVTKDENGEVGEVSAEDVQGDAEYLCQTWSTELPSHVQSEGKKSKHNIFNHALSHTWKPLSGETWTITYGDGSSAGGNVGTDVVELGGIQIKNQAVELASRMSSSFRSNQGDGLLGLAFDTINTVQPNQVHTPVQNMIQQAAIPAGSELFTAHLGSVNDTSDPDNGSSFYTFGVIDAQVLASNKATVNDIHYTPVDNSNGFWQVASSTYTINGTQHSTAGHTAVMDTGTTLALVDDQTCKNIYAAIPGTKLDNSVGGYIFPTSTPTASLPLVGFAIGNATFTISREDLAFAPAGNGYSYGGIQSAGDLPFAIYGDVVLRNIYAIFDVGKMQFGCIQRLDSSTAPNAGNDKCGSHGNSCQSCDRKD